MCSFANAESLFILSAPSLLNTPCVIYASTISAPSLDNACAALINVPPVSTISSTIIHCFPLTLPMTFIASDSLALSRLLSIIAISQFNTFASDLARGTPPASGETITPFPAVVFIIGLLPKLFANNGFDFKSSTGTSKNPCICPACKSIVKTRLAPAVSIMFATNLAVIGVLDLDLRSCLPYPR